MTQPIMTDPPYGSVAMFAQLLRVGTQTLAEVNRRAVASMSIAMGHASASDEERVEHIRNLLTAVELVRGELRQQPVACWPEYHARIEAQRNAAQLTPGAYLITSVRKPDSAPEPPQCSPECQAQPEEWPCLDSCPAQIAARS